MRWADRFRPGAVDLVFAVVLLTTWIGGRFALLNDPGTFWHLELGRSILSEGAVPRSDGLTYTRAGTAWVDQSWAFDAGLAWLHGRWGWPGAVGASSLLLAAIYAGLAGCLIREGRTPLVAAVTAILAAGVSSIHFLVRPHLFTMAFVLITFRLCKGYHERGGRGLWAIPPLMVAWANLHGGFLAGPLIVATAAVGHAVSGPWDETRRRRLIGFALAFGASCVAPLVNPYGFDLYRHVAGLLVSSRVTDLIQEYQPAPFGQPQARVLEWFVLALIALPSLCSRRLTRYELAETLVWLHLALGSIRHAPLFALAAAPGLARLIDGLMPDREPARTGPPTWSIGLGLLVVATVLAGRGPGGPNPATWPLSTLPALDAEPADLPLFHEQDWGGLVACETRPRRRSFLDDRFELFGRAAILEYVEALNGGPAWDAVCARHGVELAWLKPDRPLARRLEADPAWRVVRRDAVSVLFRRRR